MLTTRTMNYQGYLEDAWRILKAEPVILVLGGLLIQLLTVLSMGIMAGPLLGGYILLIIHYLRDNRKPSFNDIFSGLQQIGSLLPYFLVLLLIFFGFMMLVLPGLLLATWWLYVLPLMVDRKMAFTDAMRLSMKMVNETGFLVHFVFLLLISILPIFLLNFLSTMIPPLFILKVLLPPFQACCVASLYVDRFGQEEAAAAPAETPAADIPAAEVPTAPDAKAAEQAAEAEENKPDAGEVPDRVADRGDETPPASGDNWDGEKQESN